MMNLRQTEIVGFSDSTSKLFLGLVVLSSEVTLFRRSSLDEGVHVVDVAVTAVRRCNRVAELEVVASDNLDSGKVLADRLTQLGVVGCEGVGVGFDEVACGVEGRRTAGRLVGRGDGRLVHNEAFTAVSGGVGQLHWMAPES